MRDWIDIACPDLDSLHRGAMERIQGIAAGQMAAELAAESEGPTRDALNAVLDIATVNPEMGAEGLRLVLESLGAQR